MPDAKEGSHAPVDDRLAQAAHRLGAQHSRAGGLAACQGWQDGIERQRRLKQGGHALGLAGCDRARGCKKLLCTPGFLCFHTHIH